MQRGKTGNGMVGEATIPFAVYGGWEFKRWQIDIGCGQLGMVVRGLLAGKVMFSTFFLWAKKKQKALTRINSLGRKGRFVFQFSSYT